MATEIETAPVIEIFDALAPEVVHAEASRACTGPRWYFGHESHHDDELPFWAIDLNGDKAISAIWALAKERCESLAGRPLRVIRQYATGHTYGLGGKPHTDDPRSGCFTLLYYAMPEWKQEWDGETVFFDKEGEVVLAVPPRPNRAVFFDSRIIHAGRAPSRACPKLRIAVAFKLEPAPVVVSPGSAEAPGKDRDFDLDEISGNGVDRVFEARARGDRMAAAIESRLMEMAQSIRLPGFRAGKIPLSVLEQRYGARARAAVEAELSRRVSDELLRLGGLTAATEVISSGDRDWKQRIHVTWLPDLPEPAVGALVRLTMPEGTCTLEGHFRRQILDQLDGQYQFVVAPALIDQEMEAIRKAAAGELRGIAEEDREEVVAEMHAIAERRVRLGAVLAELARRYAVRASDEEVLAILAARAQVTERVATEEEIAQLE